ncbi:hypothetical protein AAZX31_08G088500 [Glycine max]|nr:hypothetical protein GLYMA_08G090850v4 [Glycine max]KAH1050349.1 hypothetical protein GYH30_020701 [Glycine max]
MEAGLWNIIEQKWDSGDRFLSFIFTLLQESIPQIRVKIGAVLWCIWKTRNTKLWEQISTTPRVAYSTAMQNITQWEEVQKPNYPAIFSNEQQHHIVVSSATKLLQMQS